MADIAVLAIIGIFAYFGYKKGLVKTVLKLSSKIMSLVITLVINPFISKFLRESTGLYEFLKEYISETIGLNEFVSAHKGNPIYDLDLPDALKLSLIESNNYKAHDVLNVSGIEDYVSAYLATICINILSIIILYLIVKVGFRLLTDSLQIISKLPVVKQLNKTSGLVVGAFEGTIVVWILFTVLTFFFVFPAFLPIYEAINDSTIALAIYKVNILQLIMLRPGYLLY